MQSYHQQIDFVCLTGVTPVHMLLEMGLDKMRKDYINYLIGNLTLGMPAENNIPILNIMSFFCVFAILINAKWFLISFTYVCLPVLGEELTTLNHLVRLILRLTQFKIKQ